MAAWKCPFAVLLSLGCAVFLRAASWDSAAAAKYLDARATWWESWPNSQRDHQTVCVSCHTMLPYVLSRSKLSAALGEAATPAPEAAMFQSIRKRVSLWNDVQPYYLDAKSGPGKSRESRATESVLNAMVLASADAGRKQLDPITLAAFQAAWTLQLKSGEHAGAWDWQLFHLSPWEAAESQYQGATFMALALGWTPKSYRRDAAIESNIGLLRAYLRRDYAAQPLLNRIVVLWASTKLPGLLSKQEKGRLLADIARLQRPDGGWNLASLGNWTRSDHTPQSPDSDGYATGLITLALNQTRDRRYREKAQRGTTWLEQHQDKTDGSWRAVSLNKQRDASKDAARFMTDAATGYAVMALASSKPQP